ncbi:MAG TPA: response regulator transcription factor [Rhodocyclaceae bacterium]
MSGGEPMQPAAADPIGVFLVDDHRCMLWGLEKLVAGEQPRMRVAGKAGSREEALAGIAAAQPDVVLLDLDLGGCSSLEFLPQLLESSAAQVLVLTGTRDSDSLDRAIALGARGIVSKEEAADVLVSAIEGVHRGELWLDRAAMARVLGAMTRPRRAEPQRCVEPLTPKERQIVAAIVAQRGAKGDVIAAQLHMSGHTLRNHLTTIYRKLDVKNRLELVMFALENGLAAPAH